MPRAIFPLAALLGAAAATTGHQRTGLASAKRGLMTCEETYGQGWGRCGDETSIFCYNPSLGQVSKMASIGGWGDGGWPGRDGRADTSRIVVLPH